MKKREEEGEIKLFLCASLWSSSWGPGGGGVGEGGGEPLKGNEMHRKDLWLGIQSISLSKHSSDESAQSLENRLYTTPTNFGLDTKYP